MKELSKLRQEIAHLRAEEVIRNETERQTEQERQKQVLAEVKEAKVSDHELADVKETLKESEEAVRNYDITMNFKCFFSIPSSLVMSVTTYL